MEHVDEHSTTTDPLQLLKDTDLLGKPLLTITDPVIIERYNACLEALDIPQTTLTRFSIDCMGYSPEIATEKGDIDYLSHGGVSNPYAIIVSPNQEGVPIVRPYYSFYEEMMKVIFKTFKGHFSDITLHSALYIDMDEGFDHIDSPQALLLLEGVYPRFHVLGSVVEAAKLQHDGVLMLLKEDSTHWADTELIEKMRESIRQYGDLRYKRMQLRELPFTQVHSFYTSAFGGVYVLRDEHRNNNVLICMQEEKAYRTENGHSEYRLGDVDLIDRLVQHDLVDLNSEYYRQGISTQKLERLAECLFVNALVNKNETVDIVAMSEAKRTKRIQKMIENGKLPAVYSELVMLAHESHLRRRALIKKASPELKKLLAHPSSEIKGNTRLIIHRLLAHLQPVDILDIYKYARETFLEMYVTWPKNKQFWAVDLLRRQLYRTE